MKLTAILLFSISLQVCAKEAYTQSVSLDVKNASLKKVFKEIRKQTGYYFLYSNEILDKADKVNVVVANTPLKDALDKCLQNTSLTYSIVEKTIIIKPVLVVNSYKQMAAIPPPIEVKGKVTNENGEPLNGATIREKGTNNATTSDASGNFSISVKDAKSVLVISYVGYKSFEGRTNGNGDLAVVLTVLNSSMNDVVVVGYGSQRKKDITGAISIIDKKVIENRPVANVLDALQGTAPGLVITRDNGQPGQQGFNANIRGFSSLNGTNNPLTIIDGVEGDLNLLNPNDIESISVLKDAAAAAIYGAKSSGGVIVVTTKKGAADKVTINFSSLYSINQFYNIPKPVSTGLGAYMEEQSGRNSGGPIGDRWTDDEIRWFYKDTGVVFQRPGMPYYGSTYYYNTDMASTFLKKNSQSQTYNLSVSGGNEKTKYFFSVGKYSQDGILRFGPDETNRYNSRFNMTTKLNSFLTFDSRIYYSQSKTLSPNGNLNGDYGMFYNIFMNRHNYPIYMDGTNFLNGNGPGQTMATLRDGGKVTSLQNSFNGVFSLRANELVKGLSLEAIYSPKMDLFNNDQFQQSVPMYGYNNEQPSVQYYWNNPNGITKNRASATGEDLQFLANYGITINKNHNFHFLAGSQYQHYKYDYIVANNRRLISNNIPSLNLGSDPSIIPGVGDNIQENAWMSYFGRLNYNFSEKYYIEGTLRNDASSRLAPGHRNQTFPSISGAWRFNKEKWLKKPLNVFDEFKLRGSWGKLGNAQLGSLNQNNYNSIAQLSNGPVYPFNNLSSSSLYQGTLASPGLGWETIETSDLGLDMGLMQNKLYINLDYFVRRNNNMLIVLNQPVLLGVDPSTSNGASMKTWGWEANVGWKDNTHAFNYFINLNVSDNKNKILEYKGNVVYQEGLNTAIPGYSINSIFGFTDQGYFKDAADVTAHAYQDNRTGAGDIKYQDVNGDNKINVGNGTASDHGDLVYLGNTSPRYNFGLSLGGSWKGFDLSIFFQGVGKRAMEINSYYVVPFVNPWRQPTQEQTDYWTPDHTNAKFPRLYLRGDQNTHTSSHWVQNAAYISLKNVQVGYTIPQAVTQKIKIQSARIFFSGQDIWQTSKMWLKSFNPENPTQTNYQYPFAHIYALGLNVSF